MESKELIVGPRSPRRLVLITAIFIPLLLLFIVLIWSLINQQSGIQEDPMNRNFSSQTMRGIPAPAFTLELFDGDMFRLADASGEPTVVSFWSSWCPSCRLEAPIVVEMDRRYHEIGVNFIGIAIWDSEANAKKFASEHGLAFPVGLDKNGSIAIDYGVTGLPEKFFINRDGEIVKKLTGPVSEQQMEEAILSIVER
jgi:cytochrome c biogenesis protein CcmG/thiol:disulfide interchange protein DsbE